MFFRFVFLLMAFIALFPGGACAVTCGNYECGTARVWTSLGNGYDVLPTGTCRTINRTSYCAASSIRCSAGYYAADVDSGCQTAPATTGYYSQYACFTLLCESCADEIGDRYATSTAGSAQNVCQCYLPASRTFYGTNGYYVFSEPCYYTTACPINIPAIETPTNTQS